jgi:micrococcal nuclease
VIDRSRRSIVKRTRPRASAWAIAAALIVLAYRGFQEAGRPPGANLPPAAGEVFRVRRAVDGDTLLLENGVRVRLLGVDTPETKHPDRPPEPWGEEASDYTHRLVDGRNVTLEYDRERVDDYGRTLAYVFIDGRMLNELLIAEGYSRAMTRHPYRTDRKKLFEAAEEKARNARKGIWSGQSHENGTDRPEWQNAR